MQFTCRAARVLSGCALLCASGATVAQTWPAKPVRVVIPWPPGGSNDVVGRIVMQKVGESLGQDRKSTRLNSSHSQQSRMPSSA